MTEATQKRGLTNRELIQTLRAAGKSTASAVLAGFPRDLLTAEEVQEFVARAPDNLHLPLSAEAHAAADARADTILAAANSRSLTNEAQAEFDTLVDQMNAGKGWRAASQSASASAFLQSYQDARVAAVTAGGGDARRDRHVRSSGLPTAEDRQRSQDSMRRALAEEGIATKGGGNASAARASMTDELKRIGMEPTR